MRGEESFRRMGGTVAPVPPTYNNSTYNNTLLLLHLPAPCAWATRATAPPYRYTIYLTYIYID